MLFHEVAAKRCEILVKGKKDLSFSVRVKSLRNEKDFICETFGKNIPPELFDGEEILVQIDLNGELYFMKSVARWHDELLVIATTAEVYQLQRRQTWRIKIPRSYKAKATIEKLGTMDVNIEGQVVDFSVGGTRIQFPATLSHVSKETPIQIMLSFGNRNSILITGFVRHKQIDAANDKFVLFGVEFKPVSQLMESRLFALSMDLHRELFVRNKASG